MKFRNQLLASLVKEPNEGTFTTQCSKGWDQNKCWSCMKVYSSAAHWGHGGGWEGVSSGKETKSTLRAGGWVGTARCQGEEVGKGGASCFGLRGGAYAGGYPTVCPHGKLDHICLWLSCIIIKSIPFYSQNELI